MATNSTMAGDNSQTPALSENQDRLLALLPIIPAFWSAWGSANILYMFCTSNKSSSYRRIMFGLSLCDFISSVLIPFQSFLVPRETSSSVWAIGTDGTCSFMGFAQQFGFASIWYSSFLSVYFLLLIRFGVKDAIFKRRYEPWMHVACVGYPLATAIVGAVLGLYGELDIGDGCWITNWPEGCDDDDPDLPNCLSSTFGWIFSGIPTLFSFLLIVINNIVVYRHVQKAIQHAQLNSVRSAGNTRLDPHIKRVKAVQTQSFFYVAAFLFTYLPAFALRVLESFYDDPEDEARLFPLLVIQMITLPSQGLLNCLIYVRPTYLKARREFPDESMYWAFQRALHGERVQPTDEHRPSSLYGAPASQVALTRTKEKPSELDMSALTTADNETSTTHLDALDSSSRLGSSNHDQREHPSPQMDVDSSTSLPTPGNSRTTENPPIMPRRLETFVEEDFDEMLLVPDNDDNNNTSTGSRFGLGWKKKRSSSQQPNSSQFESSLVVSELECIDEAPGQPVRVASQAESTLPPTSRSRKHDSSPVAPRRVQSGVMENPPTMPQRLDTDIEDELDEPAIKDEHDSRHPFKGFLLSWKKKRSSAQQRNPSQFVSSLAVDTELDCNDEGPSHRARVESQGETPLPSARSHPKKQPPPSGHRGRVESQGEPPLPARRSKRERQPPPNPRSTPQGLDTDSVARPTMPRRVDTDVEDIPDDYSV